MNNRMIKNNATQDKKRISGFWWFSNSEETILILRLKITMTFDYTYKLNILERKALC